MTTKNADCVAVHSDKDAARWSLIVPSEAETCEEQTQEMIDLCERFFRTFGEFVTPTHVEFDIPCFPAGHELPASIHDDSKIRTAHRTLREPSGIELDDVVAATRVEACPARWLPRVRFVGTRVLVDLAGGPVRADRNQHTAEYRRERPTGECPDRDPLELELLHGPNSWESEVDAAFVTSVTVRTVSDIWFEDSELGRLNAERLGAFLQRVEETLPVTKVVRSRDWLPAEELEAIY